MRLVQKEDAVTGCYSYSGRSEISGTVEGGVLRFTYTEPTGDTGSGEFNLANDGTAFSGSWKLSTVNQGGAWGGTRVKPLAGRTWLVVLEAHWEASLQQPEYSYGDMLRQFFTREPGIAVRHRYFDGKDDFSRWCAELPYLNEPAVLYVSSHGTEEGITVGNQVLGGEFIGSQLRHATEIRLVHLGACLTMSGTTPAAIREACGTSLPVSGFTKVADWAGSAVIDFAYLDLVLARKLPPAEAVRQIQRGMNFAGEPPWATREPFPHCKARTVPREAAPERGSSLRTAAGGDTEEAAGFGKAGVDEAVEFGTGAGKVHARRRVVPQVVGGFHAT